MEVEGFDWDDGNIEYIAKHNVSPAEIEEVCANAHFYRRDPDSKSQGRERYVVSGKTDSGRYLDVVLEKLYDRRFRPITAFDMSENYKAGFKRRMANRTRK